MPNIGGGLGGLIAAGGLPPLVQDLGICLVAAVALASLCERLRLPHFIGFIAAGLVVGPPVLGAVHGPADIRVMADLGIVMLLFLLGVELDVAALRERGRGVLTVGVLQVPLTVGVSLVAWLGLAAVVGWPARFEEALYLALATAFSSTLLVVRSLEGGERLASAMGTLCIGTLLAQDLWALLILSLQPGGGASASGLLSPIVGTALLGGVAWLVGRPLMTAVIVQFEESEDLLSLSALAWCQASEFGLVIVYLGHDLGHVGTGVVTVVLVGFVSTSALMPFLELIVRRIERPSPITRAAVVRSRDPAGDHESALTDLEPVGVARH